VAVKGLHLCGVFGTVPLSLRKGNWIEDFESEMKRIRDVITIWKTLLVVLSGFVSRRRLIVNGAIVGTVVNPTRVSHSGSRRIAWKTSSRGSPNTDASIDRGWSERSCSIVQGRTSRGRPFPALPLAVIAVAV
jgi:hypothetical protein